MNRLDNMVMKFRDVLSQTERLSPDDIRTYQHERLQPLLRHAQDQVPFYRQRLAPVLTGDTFDFSRWAEIPVFTRSDAAKAGRRLRAKTVPQPLGRVWDSETSGSMGRPLQFAINELVEVSSLAMTDRLYRWWRFDGNGLLAVLVPPRTKLSSPEGTETHGWRSGFMKGRSIMRSSAGDIDAHIDWLVDTGPDYLIAYPSLIRALAERCRDRAIVLRLKAVISRGWMVDTETWQLCREVFGAPLVDHYGANEVGSIACQCPHCSAYHVNAESVLAEILDDAGRPVAPGETGRVVLTSFYNYAMPFIRYEIGDYAQTASGGTSCEFGLPRLARIMGRYRNVFTLRNGTIIYPNPPMSRLREFLAYRQIQVVQTAYEQLEIRYVPSEPDRQVDAAGLESWLKQQLDPSFTIRLVKVKDIPALPSGKFEEFVSEVRQEWRG